MFSAKWREPAGKTFDRESWCELQLEIQKLFHLFGVVNDSDLRQDIPRLVKDELKKRKLKYGLLSE